MSVDVIIPCYNGERFLRQTIESALSQTYQPIRVLVVDDGSTDGSRRIVESFEGRLGYLYKENGGQASARNLGISRTAGEYVCLLDADDLIEPEMIARLVARLECNPNADLAHCRQLEFWDDERSLPFTENWRPGVAWQSYLEPLSVICAIHGSATVFRRRAFDRYGFFPEARSLQGSEDWHFFLRAVLEGAVVEQVPEVLCFYRLHRQGSSASGWGIARRESELMKEAARLFVGHAMVTDRNRAVLAAGMFSVAARWLVPGEEEAFRELARLAREIAPADFRDRYLLPPPAEAGRVEAAMLHLRLCQAMLELGNPHLAAVFFLRAGDGRELRLQADRRGETARLERLAAAMATIVAEELRQVRATGSPSYATFLAASLGMIARAERRGEDARGFFERALELDPSNFEAALELLIIDFRAGRVREVLDRWRRIAHQRFLFVPRRLLSRAIWMTLSGLRLKSLVVRSLEWFYRTKDRLARRLRSAKRRRVAESPA